ncbi:MAG TPA: sulfite exporter TauE/SafE family protein, partial [Terriglobia bacterium]|nr:sulfite exporter TauE/SafE family protein [Terriglobia bacterium]
MRLELLFPLSIIAGFVGAMGGMGGGIILIPALTYFGVDIKHAIALSIVSVIATSSGSASAYVRDHITNLKIGMFLEIFTMLGAISGARMTLTISARILFFLLGAVLMSSAVVLWFKRGEEWTAVVHQDRISHW